MENGFIGFGGFFFLQDGFWLNQLCGEKNEMGYFNPMGKGFQKSQDYLLLLMQSFVRFSKKVAIEKYHKFQTLLFDDFQFSKTRRYEQCL